MRKAIVTPVLAGLIGLAALAIPAAAQAETGPTDTTLTVNAGLLSISTPDSADLGSLNISSATLAGTDHVSGALGTVTVDDRRASAAGSWTVSVVSTDFSTGSGDTAYAIPAASVTYTPGATTHKAGTADFSAGTADVLDNSTELTAYSAANEVGVTTVSWDPNLNIHMPSSTVAGSYDATVTHSVA